MTGLKTIGKVPAWLGSDNGNIIVRETTGNVGDYFGYVDFIAEYKKGIPEALFRIEKKDIDILVNVLKKIHMNSETKESERFTVAETATDLSKSFVHDRPEPITEPPKIRPIERQE